LVPPILMPNSTRAPFLLALRVGPPYIFSAR
jgi:hypothetical protein